MLWTVILVATGCLGLWLAPRHWFGWAISSANEVLWFAFARLTNDTPLTIMACVWFALNVRATWIAYRKAHPYDIERELQGARGDF